MPRQRRAPAALARHLCRIRGKPPPDYRQWRPFDWGLASLAEKELFFLDAHLSPTLVTAGDFDLAGMLAMLAAKKVEIGAQWIVFDGLDVLLTLLQDPVAEMREIYRIRDWLADNALTAIVTAKTEERTSEAIHYGFLQFMVDCVVRFERRQEDRVSAQSIQITKYRGSGYAAAEFPLSFGPSGIEVGGSDAPEIGHGASSERITAGFERLDAMLGGGVFRGSSTLVTGVPGTSKTTLAGKFAEAACRRGERTLFVSFDEGAEQIARNLSSVGIQLGAHVKSGLLRMYSRAPKASARKPRTAPARPGSALNSSKSAASCNLPKPGPLRRSKHCKWIWRSNAPNWPCTPVKTRYVANPRTNGRTSCAEGAARTPQTPP